MDFVHLHVHSNFSFMDGAAPLDRLIERAAALGMKSLAVTDHQGLYGAIRFYKKARAAGINPIIGVEIAVDISGAADDEISPGGHLILLAKNKAGYSNLCRLLSEGHLEWGLRNGYGDGMKSASSGAGTRSVARRAASAKTAALAARPNTMTVSMETLRRYSSDLIALSGCPKGEIGRAIMGGRMNDARAAAARYEEIFGTENFFIELQNQRLPESPSYMSKLVEVAEWLRDRAQKRAAGAGATATRRTKRGFAERPALLPLVLTNNVHYVDKDDYKLHDVLCAAGANTTLPGPIARPNAELYFKTPGQMRYLLRGLPREAASAAYKNTALIADRCRLDLELGAFRFPDFPIPEGETHYSILAKETWRGAEERYKVITPEVVSRIEHELALIEKMGFSAYFLIVKDIVDFAKSQNIFCSGRGSAGDSIISYCLGITSVDPIKYDLLFERFLNPKRADMPDIDVDFCSKRRDEVVEYIFKRYGREHVAMVATVNTMNARGALRVAGKAFGLGEEELGTLTRHMPWISAHRIRESVASYPELSKSPLRDEAKYGLFLDITERLSGFPAHLGTHLGGFVITPEPIANLVPLQWAAKGTVVAQYDKDDIEDMGLVKMDILGLRMHSAIAETSQKVAEITGEPFDPYELVPDDPKAYRLIGSARTIGLFQLESSGQRNLATRLKEENFNDIVAAISLFRPGPLQADMIGPYIRRRHGKEKVTVPHPSMMRPLRDTYGVIIYQEQVLSVAAAVAGFDLAEADMLRRAMTADKSLEEMDRIGEHFVQRATERNVSEEAAREVFRQLRGFAAYGFNKAHGACFAVLSYASAWLKAHYPAEFLAAILNHQPMGFYSSRVVLNDARHFGIKILPPDINESGGDFKSVDLPGEPRRGAGAIRVGLKYLRELSGAELSQIRSERKLRPFTSFADFYRRTGVSKPVAENLISIGAFDCFMGAGGTAPATAAPGTAVLAPATPARQALSPMAPAATALGRDQLLIELDLIHKVRQTGKGGRSGGLDLEPGLPPAASSATSADATASANAHDFPAPAHDTGHGRAHPSGWSSQKRLAAELDILGLNISCHPLTPYRDQLATLGVTLSKDIPRARDKSFIRVVGLRERAQTPPTKSKKRTVFLTLEDEMGLIDVVVFEDALARYGAVIAHNRCYIVEGTLQNNSARGIAIVAEHIEPFTPLGPSAGKGLAGNTTPGLPATIKA